MRNSALITGISGQDGSYLTELILGRGYRVVGAVRDGVRASLSMPKEFFGRVELVEWDMLDQHRMTEVLEEYRPAEIYNFAAYSSGAGMFDDPEGIGEVNGLAVARMLEAIRAVDVNIRFCQASSREIFGESI
jgi:GDPmannose 4,6-dehydratase